MERCEMTSQDVDEIARVAGRAAALETLAALGVDVHSPTEMQADFVYLRRWRKLIERIQAAAILSLISAFGLGLAGLVWAGFKITVKI